MAGSEFATVISLAFDDLLSLLRECKLQEGQDLCPLCSLTHLKEYIAFACTLVIRVRYTVWQLLGCISIIEGVGVAQYNIVACGR